mmetsp:Transcript_48069/g.88563  ORF Transcript_48069/g.88563 Transcript_48069/m.88563 type:complete len:302 (+) Transcript_48069:52-957(+)
MDRAQLPSVGMLAMEKHAWRNDQRSVSEDDSKHAALVAAAIDALESSGMRLMACGRSDREILQRTLIQLSVDELPDGEALAAIDALLQWELGQKSCTLASQLPRCQLDSRLVLWRGDITTLVIDAIVNAANEAGLGCFQPEHRCIDNVIHCAAGPELRRGCHEELLRLNVSKAGQNVLPTGQAMVTRAYNLPSKFIVHTPGPIGEKPSLLAQCYKSVLDSCRRENIRSVAFCCISTGLFGYPADKAAQVALQTVRSWLDEDARTMPTPSIDFVVFNTFLQSDYAIYSGLLGEIEPIPARDQ